MFYLYLQIKHFFHSLSPFLTLAKPTSFEYLCAKGPHQLHLVFYIYRFLHEAFPLTENTNLYMCKWAQWLRRPITSQMWNRIWTSTFKCVVQREPSITILMFWYRTLEVIHNYDPSSTAKYWHCGLEVWSLLHIFWQCSLIQPFSHEVMLLLQKVVDLPLPLDPIHYVLGSSLSGIAKHIKQLISYILLAAKRDILLYWLSNIPPLWSRFLQLITDIRRMEYLTATVHDTIPQFNKIWEQWNRSEFGSPLPGSIMIWSLGIHCRYVFIHISYIWSNLN